MDRADIESIFKKQLDGIQDNSLRQKVVDTWMLGCKNGNWDSVDDLKKMPFTLLTETHGVSFVDHTIAVTEGAVGLGKAQTDFYQGTPYKIDFDRLYAGGLLHDVGKLMEIQPDGKGGYHKSLSGKFARHPMSGAMIARECGIPEDILNIIICRPVKTIHVLYQIFKCRQMSIFEFIKQLLRALLGLGKYLITQKLTLSRLPGKFANRIGVLLMLVLISPGHFKLLS